MHVPAVSGAVLPAGAVVEQLPAARHSSGADSLEGTGPHPHYPPVGAAPSRTGSALEYISMSFLTMRN